MKNIAVVALLVMFVLLFATVPTFLPKAHALLGGSQTYYPANSEYDDSDCSYLSSTVPSFATVVGNYDFCTNYVASTQTLTTATVTLNYYTTGEPDPTVSVQLYDDTQDNTLAATPEAGVSIDGGGSCDAPLTVTFSLTVTPGAQLRTNDVFELDLSYTGEAETYWTVLGSGECVEVGPNNITAQTDITTPTEVTIGFQAAPAPLTNPCQLGLSCSTAFAVFSVLQPTGAPVGGATVTLSASGLPTQSLTTASAASTSLICTNSASWTAMWGVYWGCNAGETGQFILEVGVTYSYTVTITAGNVITGTLGPSTTPGTSAWTVTIVPVTS